MALCHNCDDSRKEYIANGTQNDFPFEFTYYKKEDVEVAYWNTAESAYKTAPRSDWDWITDTSIEFNEVLTAGTQFIIYRCTDVTELAEFFPGTAIKAADLNDNFFILSSAIEDARCEIERTSEEFLQNGDIVTREEQETDGAPTKITNENVFSTGASVARYDSYIQDEVPPTPALGYEQPGKLWQNTKEAWTSYWQESPSSDGNISKTWVAYVNTGPKGEKGDPGPEGPGIPDVDIDGVVYGRQDQNWVPIDFGGGGTINGISGEDPIIIDSSTPEVPKVTFDISVLSDLP